MKTEKINISQETPTPNPQELEPVYRYNGGQLNPNLDTKWLASVIDKEALNEEWFEKANQLIDEDTKLITHPDSAERERVLAVRQSFFDDVLGFKNGASLLEADVYDKIRHFHATLLPIGTVLGAIYCLNENGLDSKKIINTLPQALNCSQESIEEKIAFLDDRGLDSKKIINFFPTTLSYSQENIENKIAFLDEQGLDSKKIINSLPATLGLSQEYIEEKIKLARRLVKLSGQDMSPEDIINSAPSLIGSSSKKLLAQARLVLENAVNVETAPEDILTLVIKPMESHILTAADNPPDKSYKQNLRASYRQIEPLSKTNRTAYTLEQINQPATSQKIGKKAILAFLRYKTKDGNKPISDPDHKYDNLSRDFPKYFSES
ncbi:MAG: hypothetical protein LBQ02_02595 [Candidatus Nomurabacteria bacterium]|jgi:hypothetical protein|nr:hypothetical protein [Candidatus Nomurabacteria bacterium]